MKKGKRSTESHVSKTGYPFGDYYGTGIRQPVGRMRDTSVGYNPLSKKKIKTPPKSVV